MTKATARAAAAALAALLFTQAAGAALPPGLLKADEPTLAPMLEDVLPAVVNVVVTGKAQTLPNHPLFQDPFFRRFFDMPEQPRRPQAAGSGVIVDAGQGLVLTNHHVIDQAEEITVRLKDDREFQAELVGADSESDIAVLKIDADNLKDIPIADSDKLRVGDFVVAIGNPFGLRQTVTSGIVSGLGRHGLGKRYEDFIQTDASINPGNSGGALVNLDGRLVGINTAILSQSGGNIGIGFAIPTNLATTVMRQIVEHGEVRRGRLGVVGQDLTNDLAGAFDLDADGGVVIAQVMPDSPAAKAGLRERDVIVAINGSEIRDFSELANAIGLRQPGEKVEVTFIRDGKRRTITATLAEMDEEEVSVAPDDLFDGLSGARFADVPESHPLAGEVDGVAVVQVAPGSRPASGRHRHLGEPPAGGIAGRVPPGGGRRQQAASAARAAGPRRAVHSGSLGDARRRSGFSRD
jgi:serine protease Do/serine protease DegQ